MVTEMCLPFSSMQGNWMSTERSLNNAWNPYFRNILWAFSGHSQMFQLTKTFILWRRCRTIKIPPCLNARTMFFFLQPFTDNDDVSIWVIFSIWAPVFHKVLTFNTMVKVMTCTFESRFLEDPVIKICWVKTIWILL